VAAVAAAVAAELAEHLAVAAIAATHCCLDNESVAGQFAAVALTVVDPLHLAAEIAKDHVLRFLPTNNYFVNFLIYIFIV